MNIATLRLQNQHLIGPQFAQPEDVVDWNGCVQAQDYPGAKWAVGQRVVGCTDTGVEQAFNDGKILRTHILRPTWHFVSPKDIRWMQDLTAPRVDAFCRYYYKKLELDDDMFKKANKVLVRALEANRYMTREEVRDTYRKAGIKTSSLGASYLVMKAEIDALICSGPMRGKQHTLALVADRAPQATTLPRDEALVELTKRYFMSHGPAQIKDFAWWSSLTMVDIKRGIELLGNFLAKEEIDGKTFYFCPTNDIEVALPTIHMIPNYDEVVVAYRDHVPSVDPIAEGVTVAARTMLFDNHLVLRNGLVIGGWRREQRKNGVNIAIRLACALGKKEAALLDNAVARLQDFLQTDLSVTCEIVQK